MEKKCENLKNRALQKKVKSLIEKSKKRGFIKPHTDAFKEISVKDEEHKGLKKSFGK